MDNDGTNPASRNVQLARLVADVLAAASVLAGLLLLLGLYAASELLVGVAAGIGTFASLFIAAVVLRLLADIAEGVAARTD